MKSENADKIKNAFTVQSEHFETHKANFMKKEHLDYVISEVQPQKTDSVLEVAAGTCICGRSFAPYVGQVTCLDLTPAMLSIGKEQAEKQGFNNMVFVTGDAGELPFLDNSFDIVVSRLAFHHFPNVNRPFSEMTRVLKSGGKFVFIDMEAAEETLRTVQDEIETLRDPSHIRNLSKTEMLKLFSDNGLTVEKCNTTKIKKNLAEWLDFAKTQTNIMRDITNRFMDDLDGKSKTGFQPYKSSEGICFDHKWTMIIGRKPSKT